VGRRGRGGGGGRWGRRGCGRGAGDGVGQGGLRGGPGGRFDQRRGCGGGICGLGGGGDAAVGGGERGGGFYGTAAGGGCRIRRVHGGLADQRGIVPAHVPGGLATVSAGGAVDRIRFIGLGVATDSHGRGLWREQGGHRQSDPQHRGGVRTAGRPGQRGQSWPGGRRAVGPGTGGDGGLSRLPGRSGEGANAGRAAVGEGGRSRGDRPGGGLFGE